MRVALIVPAHFGESAEPELAENIQLEFDDELDGPSAAQFILDIAAAAPLAVGSLAATLAATNKAIDELRKLTKRFLPKSPDNDRTGLFDRGERVLTPSSSEAETDAYFDDLRQRAAAGSRK